MTNEFLLKYQNLVYSLMKYFKSYPNKDDLFQAGCMGVLKAYKNYNESLGVKFSTYAYSYILGEMKKLVREDRGVKINKQMRLISSKIDKAKILLEQRLMREPTNHELANFLEIPEYILEETLRSNQMIYSLDVPISTDGKDLYLSDIISSHELDINTLLALKQELLNLNELDRKLIEESINSNLTQTELADKYDMTQVQVSRKIKKIKEKVKSNLTV